MKALLRKYILPVTVGVACALGANCLAGGIVVGGPSIVISPPTVVVSPPAPPPVVVVTPTVTVVPDDYYWDGTEYVGIVGGQYYYLGPGNVWIVMDAPRLHRFNVWIGAHPDWRTHYAVHNDKYRGNYGHDHPQPMHDTHDNAPMHGQQGQPGYDHGDHHGPPQ